MTDAEELEKVLVKKLGWNKARLKFLSMFIIALFKVKTVNLSQIAVALNPFVKNSSNYRRTQRFFASFEIDYDEIARLMVWLIGEIKGGYILSIDRTD